MGWKVGGRFKKRRTFVNLCLIHADVWQKINKIDKPFAIAIKNKREKNQINKIRSEKGKVTTDKAEIQRIIRDYYEKLYGNKIDNL